MERIQAKLDNIILLTGMQKGVEGYCKSLKKIIDEQITSEKLTIQEVLNLIDVTQSIYNQMCEESLQNAKETK